MDTEIERWGGHRDRDERQTQVDTETDRHRDGWTKRQTDIEIERQTQMNTGT